MITDTLSLKNAISAYAHRTDLDPVLDIFISTATERLGVDLKVIENEIEALIPLQAGIYGLPEDFREMRVVRGSYGEVIPPLGIFDENAFITTHTQAAGYIIEASTVYFQQIRLIPETGENITIDYWKIPAPLVNDTDNNLVLLHYSNLYLSACMVEYSAYAINPEQAILWDAKYKAGVQAANDRATKAQYGVGLAKSAPARWYNNAPVRAM